MPMQHDLQNKVAILTGAGQGIGLRIAEKMAAAGAHVVLNDVDPERCEQAVQQVRPYGSCMAMPGDAGDPEFIQQMVQETVKQFGQLDIAMRLQASPYLEIFSVIKPPTSTGSCR